MWAYFLWENISCIQSSHVGECRLFRIPPSNRLPTNYRDQQMLFARFQRPQQHYLLSHRQFIRNIGTIEWKYSPETIYSVENLCAPFNKFLAIWRRSRNEIEWKFVECVQWRIPIRQTFSHRAMWSKLWSLFQAVNNKDSRIIVSEKLRAIWNGWSLQKIGSKNVLAILNAIDAFTFSHKIHDKVCILNVPYW